MLKPISKKIVQNVEDAFAHQAFKEREVFEDESYPKLSRQHE